MIDNKIYTCGKKINSKKEHGYVLDGHLRCRECAVKILNKTNGGWSYGHGAKTMQGDQF